MTRDLSRRDQEPPRRGEVVGLVAGSAGRRRIDLRVAGSSRVVAVVGDPVECPGPTVFRTDQPVPVLADYPGLESVPDPHRPVAGLPGSAADATRRERFVGADAVADCVVHPVQSGLPGGVGHLAGVARSVGWFAVDLADPAAAGFAVAVDSAGPAAIDSVAVADRWRVARAVVPVTGRSFAAGPMKVAGGVGDSRIAMILVAVPMILRSKNLFLADFRCYRPKNSSPLASTGLDTRQVGVSPHTDRTRQAIHEWPPA